MTHKVGYFEGNYSLIPIGPRTAWYVPEPGNPLRYTYSDGRQFVMDHRFETDGATSPRFLWAIPGLSPWDWMTAAILHDWLWELHHAGCKEVGFRESNRILSEAILTLGWGWLLAQACRVAVDLFGWRAWRRNP